jgi:sec-independent protein translocase protein TatB
MDFSFIELCLIVFLGVLLIGPKELPQVMRTLGRAVKRLQYMKYAVSRQFDDFLYDQEVDMMQKSAKNAPEQDVELEKELDEDV